MHIQFILCIFIVSLDFLIINDCLMRGKRPKIINLQKENRFDILAAVHLQFIYGAILLKREAG